uniref:Protein kinase domain-containing protein n=1 Tax=Cyprinodon variegatus TaxID=28743 RepID=A0A3Q2DHW8_CYPVA
RLSTALQDSSAFPSASASTAPRWGRWRGPQQDVRYEPPVSKHKNPFFFFRGRFSVVKRCDHRGTKRTVAVKHVNKKLMKRDQVTQELNLLQRLQHPHIVSLVDTFETSSSYAIVLEMADQGRLLDYIVSWGNLTEEKVASYLRSVLEALHYLHNCRIVHLDVKPENLLVAHNASGQPVVKLTDFGDAVQLNSALYVHPLLGSPEFASPELVLGEPVSLTSDLWSLGVVTYVLLSGASPFLDESAEETCLNICRLDFSFPRDYFHGVSQAARDFVCLLLRTDPSRRPPAGLCLQEPWVQAPQGDGRGRGESCLDTARLISFIDRRKHQTDARSHYRLKEAKHFNLKQFGKMGYLCTASSNPFAARRSPTSVVEAVRVEDVDRLKPQTTESSISSDEHIQHFFIYTFSFDSSQKCRNIL